MSGGARRRARGSAPPPSSRPRLRPPRRLRRLLPLALALVALAALIVGVARPRATLLGAGPRGDRHPRARHLALDGRHRRAALAARGRARRRPHVPRRRAGQLRRRHRLVLDPGLARAVSDDRPGRGSHRARPDPARLGDGARRRDRPLRRGGAARPRRAASRRRRMPPRRRCCCSPTASRPRATGSRSQPRRRREEARHARQHGGARNARGRRRGAASRTGSRRRSPSRPTRRRCDEVARITGGRYAAAPTAERLKQVYRDLGSRIGTKREEREVTAAFAGARGRAAPRRLGSLARLGAEAVVSRRIVLALGVAGLALGRALGGDGARRRRVQRPPGLPAGRGPVGRRPGRRRRLRARVPARRVHRRAEPTLGWPPGTSTSRSAASSGSPVGPGVTTRRSVVFHAVRGRAGAGTSSFQPFIGCIPTSGGGGRALTGVAASAAGIKPTQAASERRRQHAGPEPLAARCGSPARPGRGSSARRTRLRSGSRRRRRRPSSAPSASAASSSTGSSSRASPPPAAAGPQAEVQVRAVCARVR